MLIILVSVLFPVITEENREEINDIASVNHNTYVKLIFRVNGFPFFLILQLFNSIYLALKYFSFDFLTHHTSLTNNTQKFLTIVALPFRFSGGKGLGCCFFLATRVTIFPSFIPCKQAAVFTQTHHNMLILKSRFSKHFKWEIRSQV